MALRKKRPLAVIDTSVIAAAALSPTGAAHEVVSLWKRGYLQLVLSEEILLEYLMVLARFGLTERQLKNWTRWFGQEGRDKGKVNFVTHPQVVSVSRDPLDDPFLGTALTGHAHYIITHDKDLLVLNGHNDISILLPGDFMRRWRENWRS